MNRAFIPLEEISGIEEGEGESTRANEQKNRRKRKKEANLTQQIQGALQRVLAGSQLTHCVLRRLLCQRLFGRGLHLLLHRLQNLLSFIRWLE